MNINKEVEEKLKKVNLLISDVDGVLTDGSIYIGAGNVELKKFSVEDGAGVALAKVAGLKIAFLSGRYSPATDIRAKELKIEDVYNGMLNKIPAYEELKQKYNLEDSEIAYIGDGLIDLPVMEKSGAPLSVRNAYLPVKKAAVYVTDKNGGSGALREAVDLILKAKGVYEEAIKSLTKKVIETSSG